jgi:hypothetical protein
VSPRFAGLAESPYRSLSTRAIGFSMNVIDRQRILAMQKLCELDLAWHADAWQTPNALDLLCKADAMHALLVRRTDQLEGCSDGSLEDAELTTIIWAVAAYEEKRWPLGKVPGGKG